jgi:iron complex outermembrane receptor protein
MRGFPDGPGCGCSTQLIRMAVGDRLGTIWGPVFEGVNSNGGSIFKDVNSDGQLLVEPGFALEPLTDFTKLGNTFPSWEFGWNNQFVFKKWDLNAFFRGAVGHSLVNLLRLANEPVDLGAINSYNRVKTEKAVSGLVSSQFSSLYVENASFLKLDNISLGYSVDVRKSVWLKTLRFYATIQNVLVLTNYSGIDPEPILIDQAKFTPNFTINSDVLVSGIDRNGNYAPARTFLMGFRIGF